MSLDMGFAFVLVFFVLFVYLLLGCFLCVFFLYLVVLMICPSEKVNTVFSIRSFGSEMQHRSGSCSLLV